MSTIHVKKVAVCARDQRVGKPIEQPNPSSKTMKSLCSAVDVIGSKVSSLTEGQLCSVPTQEGSHWHTHTHIYTELKQGVRMAAPGSRVREWMQRKASHASDPMEMLKNNAKSEPKDALATRQACTVVARLGKQVVLARSSCIQTANGRAYFPMESVATEHFSPSPKRWR